MKTYVPSIIGSGELQRNAATIIKKLENSDQESFIVTRNEPKLVIMSIKRYEKLKALEDLELKPHNPSSTSEIIKSFKKAGHYSKKFLEDLEDGLKKSLTQK